MTSIGAIFTSIYHTKQLNPWPNSSASCVVDYSQLSACQGDMKPFESDPSTYGHLTYLRSKPHYSKSNLGNFQHQYLPELLVNVYNYCLMVKSVSCCYVHGRLLFSNLVTNKAFSSISVNFNSFATVVSSKQEQFQIHNMFIAI